MKNIILLSILLVSSTLLFAQNAAFKINFTINEGKIKLNKKEVSKDWKLTSFTNILDTNWRVKEGTSKINTYDDFGIVLFETLINKKASGVVGECQIYLDETEASRINPKNFFVGKITLEKLEITNNTTIEIIKKKLSNYKETESEEIGKYRFSSNGTYIFFVFNKYKKLCKITFGKDLKK